MDMVDWWEGSEVKVSKVSAEPHVSTDNTNSYKYMTSSDLIETCGLDAMKWAEAFAKVVPDSEKGDVGTLVGWFANAIERTRQELEKNQKYNLIVKDDYDNLRTLVFDTEVSMIEYLTNHMVVSDILETTVVYGEDISYDIDFVQKKRV